MDQHAIVGADPSGAIRIWNEGAERLFGYRREEALGASLDLIVPPEFREQHWKAFHAAMRAGDSKLHGAATDLPVLCKNGAVVVFPARFLFLRDARDRAVGAMSLFAPPDGRDAT